MRNSKVLELGKLFKKENATLYLVGGFVRDELLGKKSTDIDLTSNVIPEGVFKIVKGKFDVKHASKKLGTLVISKNKFSAEYTPFRSEEYVSSCDHIPNKVKFEKLLITDANRRDFSINCIYKNVITNEIVDPFNGIKCLNKKVIKQIHNRVFDVDPLRVFRMVRFASVLNFKIDKETFKCAKISANNVYYLSKDRLCEELKLIIESKHAVKGINLLIKLGVLPQSKLQNFKINPSLLCLCYDLYSNNNQDAEKFLNIFAKSNNQKDKIIKSIAFAKNFEKFKNVQTFINNEDCLFEASNIITSSKEFVKCLDKIIKEKLPLSINQLNVNGLDLIELNVKKQEIKENLNYLLMEVVRDGLKNEKNALINKIKEKQK